MNADPGAIGVILTVLALVPGKIPLFLVLIAQVTKAQKPRVKEAPNGGQ